MWYYIVLASVSKEDSMQGLGSEKYSFIGYKIAFL